MNDELGVVEGESDGFHDDFVITSLMMVTDPTSVRYDQRVEADRATINGVSIAPKERAIEIGQRIMEYRVSETVKAIHTAIATSMSNQNQ